MNNVNKTLYIPLYGKAYVSARGLLLRDEMAERIWKEQGFTLKGKAKSKWLAYNMGMRAAVFDRWVKQKQSERPEAVVLHIGCGLDSRSIRAARQDGMWFDIDFPEVIQERKRYFAESASYRMVGADIREEAWLQAVPGGVPAIVVMEGVSMYLTMEQLRKLLGQLETHFSSVELLMDTYTTFAARATRYKNPINEVGVTEVYGIDDPAEPAEGSSFRVMGELSLTPDELIAALPKREQRFFKTMFAGKMAKKIYRLYSYKA